MFNQEEYLSYYTKWFQQFKVTELVKHERILTQLIDDDSFVESLFIDEAILLRDLIRVECVNRLSRSLESVVVDDL